MFSELNSKLEWKKITLTLSDTNLTQSIAGIQWTDMIVMGQFYYSNYYRRIAVPLNKLMVTGVSTVYEAGSDCAAFRTRFSFILDATGTKITLNYLGYNDVSAVNGGHLVIYYR